jgi:hypothetical protein
MGRHHPCNVGNVGNVGNGCVRRGDARRVVCYGHGLTITHRVNTEKDKINKE